MHTLQTKWDALARRSGGFTLGTLNEHETEYHLGTCQHTQQQWPIRKTPAWRGPPQDCLRSRQDPTLRGFSTLVQFQFR